MLIGSVAGHVAAPGSSAYSMSKFAVRGLAESLRGDLRGDGIGVTLVSPGSWIRTSVVPITAA